MKLAPCIAVTMLLVGFAAQLPAAAQQLYQWVDENGRVQYSDRPPPPGASSQHKQIKKKPAKPAASTNPQAPSSYADEEAEFRKRQVEKAEKEAAEQKAQQAEAERERQCEQARQTLSRLQSGARYVRYNANGEQEYLDDKARAEETARTQKIVADLCK